MQVTLGEDGSAASKATPFRLHPATAENIGDWPPLKLPLVQRRRLSEEDRDGVAAALRLGRDLEVASANGSPLSRCDYLFRQLFPVRRTRIAAFILSGTMSNNRLFTY